MQTNPGLALTNSVVNLGPVLRLPSAFPLYFLAHCPSCVFSANAFSSSLEKSEVHDANQSYKSWSFWNKCTQLLRNDMLFIELFVRFFKKTIDAFWHEVFVVKQIW
jgi:hypothetical protein